MVAGGRAIWLLLAVGFLLGWAFEVRETAMFAWPLVVLLWRRGQVLRTLAIVAVPVLGWAAVDIGISAFAYGNPLLKLHAWRPPAPRRSPSSEPGASEAGSTTSWRSRNRPCLAPDGFGWSSAGAWPRSRSW